MDDITEIKWAKEGNNQLVQSSPNLNEIQRSNQIMQEKIDKLAKRLGIAPHVQGVGYIVHGYELTDLLNAFLDKLDNNQQGE